MKQILNIQTIESKQTNTQPPRQYWLCETDKGCMAIWDQAVKGLMDKDGFQQGMTCEVETEQKGQYTSIIQLYQITDRTIVASIAQAREITSNQKLLSLQEESKIASMMISYAKDLAEASIIGKDQIRNVAIGFKLLHNDIMEENLKLDDIGKAESKDSVHNQITEQTINEEDLI